MTTASPYTMPDTFLTTYMFGLAPEDLGRGELALFLRLARDPHRVVTKDELLRGWANGRGFATTRSLDTAACRLRARLRATSPHPAVVNVWGVGYRLLDEPLPAA